MLNLAVPVAVVLTVGDIAWPDKLAMKLLCCANAGIDINDKTNIPSDITGVFLPIGNLIVSISETFHSTIGSSLLSS